MKQMRSACKLNACTPRNRRCQRRHWCRVLWSACLCTRRSSFHCDAVVFINFVLIAFLAAIVSCGYSLALFCRIWRYGVHEKDRNWTRGNDELGSTVDQQPEENVLTTNPNQSQNQSVIDQDNLRTRKISRSHEIDEKGFHDKFCASDGSGQLEITLSVIEARNLYENTRVEQTHDGSDECNSSRAHTVKEQHAHEVHREVASFNTDNEFNRKINEEDIDFNIPGLPHSTV